MKLKIETMKLTVWADDRTELNGSMSSSIVLHQNFGLGWLESDRSHQFEEGVRTDRNGSISSSIVLPFANFAKYFASCKRWTSAINGRDKFREVVKKRNSLFTVRLTV